MEKMRLTVERLREVLSYDAATGEFRWKVSLSNAAPAGSLAGTFEKRGYRRVHIDKRTYASHRLAWLYVHGSWPLSEVDHRDGDPRNNAIDNLRVATHGENIANSKTRSDNREGIKGISYRAHIRKYQVRISKDGKTIERGCYASLEKAKAVYQEAAQRLFGEFARAA